MVHLSLQKLRSAKSSTGQHWRKLTALLILMAVSTLGHATPRILVLGDSLSAGSGIRLEDGWVQKLQERLTEKGLAYSVVNASISGETSAGGLSRLPKLLEHHQPVLVILELGGNDGLRGYPLTHLEKNLRTLISLTQAADAAPLLLGMQIPPNYGPQYSRGFAEIYPRVSQAQEVALVPFFLDQVAVDPTLMQRDGIHPTSAAQQQLLDNVWPSLYRLLQTDASPSLTSVPDVPPSIAGSDVHGTH